MKKITKKSLDELAKRMPLLSEIEMQHCIIGGTGAFDGVGSYQNPYSESAFESMCNNGQWNGGYVEGRGYVIGCVTVIGRYYNGWFESNHIGPNSDPNKPILHAADWIAYNHDRGYDSVNASGVTGVSALSTTAADVALIGDCISLLVAYERGENFYQGYQINSSAVKAALWMTVSFGVTTAFKLCSPVGRLIGVINSL